MDVIVCTRPVRKQERRTGVEPMFPAVSGWCHATRPPPSAVPSQPTLLLYVLNFNERKQNTGDTYFYFKNKNK